MRQIERWVNIVASSKGYEGLSCIRDSLVRRGSGNISRSGIKKVGKYGIEEEIKDDISCQEEEQLIPD